MIKAFIFDLDGTLIDSEVLWCKSLQRLVESRSLPITEAYTCELVFGKAWSDIVSRLRADYPSVGNDDEAIEHETIRHYLDLRGTTDIRISSSIRLLERLARRHPVAIVSGSTRRQVADAITLMGVADHLKFYLGSEDYPRGKPDPLCFLLAARRFGLEPAECLVFEDSAAGVRAALAAGMPCIALRRPGHSAQDVSGAAEILSDLADFNAAGYGVTLD
jgi:HAD superfamily hydrolase (TIGR01509 family)